MLRDIPSYHHVPATAHAKTRRLCVLFVVVALIAGAQETYKLFYRQRPFGDAGSFDLLRMWRRLTMAMPPHDRSAG